MSGETDTIPGYSEGDGMLGHRSCASPVPGVWYEDGFDCICPSLDILHTDCQGIVLYLLTGVINLFKPAVVSRLQSRLAVASSFTANLSEVGDLRVTGSDRRSLLAFLPFGIFRLEQSQMNTSLIEKIVIPLLRDYNSYLRLKTKYAFAESCLETLREARERFVHLACCCNSFAMVFAVCVVVTDGLYF